MAVTEFNLQQKALANKPYIETYGIDLLNKIAQFKCIWRYSTMFNGCQNITHFGYLDIVLSPASILFIIFRVLRFGWKLFLLLKGTDDQYFK